MKMFSKLNQKADQKAEDETENNEHEINARAVDKLKKSRKLNTKLLGVSAFMITVSVMFGCSFCGQLRWNSYLVKNEPREKIETVLPFLTKFYEITHTFPQNIEKSVGDYKQKIVDADKKIETSEAEIEKRGTRTLSVWQMKNYKYIYINLTDDKTSPQIAVLWAVPVFEPSKQAADWSYGFQNDTDMLEYLAEWKKTKKTFYTVLIGDKSVVFSGVPDYEKLDATFFSSHFEMTPDELYRINLFEDTSRSRPTEGKRARTQIKR